MNITWNPFKNKEIAIVGNASLQYDPEEIDRREFVVRINKGNYVYRYPQRGVKTNLSFFTNIYAWDFDSINNEIAIVNSINLRDENWGKTIKHKESTCKYTRDQFIWLPEENTWDIVNKLKLPNKLEPSSGAYIFNYLFYCDPLSVHIYNCDWKKTKSFYAPRVYFGPHDFNIEREFFLPEIEKRNNWFIH